MSFVSKTKLDSIDVLISKALINSCIYHDEFASVNNVMQEHNEITKEMKIPENVVTYTK